MATYTYSTTPDEDAGLARVVRLANQSTQEENTRRAAQTPPADPLPLPYPDAASYWTARIRDVLGSYVQEWRRDRREKGGQEAVALIRLAALASLDSSVETIVDLLPDQRASLKSAIRILRGA